jgi:predicted nucleic acid-binding protein
VALRYVADKSALARARHRTVAARLMPLLIGGDIGTCGVIDLELLFSARSHADVVALRAERGALPQLAITQADFDRALDVMEALARTGHHRAAGIPDLLIAAIAERHGLTVLHYDKDYDVIAKVTKQKVEWIVPAGSVP